jgi:hypothetical protein
LANPVPFHILGHQLASPFGHRVRVQLQKFGDLPISAAPQLERLQTRVQAPLLFVEQTGEQDDSRVQFVGSLLGPHAAGRHARRFQTRLPRQHLLPPLLAVRGTVQVPVADLQAGEPALPDQMQQGFLDRHMQQILQFGGEVSRRSLIDEGFRGVQQSALARKPNRAERPEAPLIKVGDLSEGVEPATVGVAGVRRELLQFAKDGDIGLGAQHLLQLRQAANAIPAQELA